MHKVQTPYYNNRTNFEKLFSVLLTENSYKSMTSAMQPLPNLYYLMFNM